MEVFSLASIILLSVFVIGYLAIIFEFSIRVNKTAVALMLAVLCWLVYFLGGNAPLDQSIAYLGKKLSDVSQILFFLLGAMTLVEIIDSHKGFNTVVRHLHTQSKRRMLIVISVTAFCLSAVLDNLTTTILMISVLRKLVHIKKDRLLLLCMVVIAANAGGAWTPIGDVTTTMLWINGQITTVTVMKALILPSIVCMIVPLGFYLCFVSGNYPAPAVDLHKELVEPGARLIFSVGIGALLFVPIFKWLTGMPPFMGMLIGLATLWLVTDVLHHRYEQREHLRVPHILTKVDVSSILFFLGILLSVDALEAAKLLDKAAMWMDTHIQSQALIATGIGMFSAIIDNVPLVAATMGMYDLSTYPADSAIWLMIAYAAGTGGSILIIGSSAGVALMGLEKIDFFTYFKKAALPAFLGFILGMLTLLIV